MTNEFKPLRVLLVEDDPGDAELIMIALNECGRPSFDVVHCKTLASGLEELRNNPDFDVVLLDLSLPDASGDKTVTQAREAAPDLPIVILTGFDSWGFSQQMLALGAQDYMTKGNVDGAAVSRAIRYAITRMRLTIEREAMVKELRASVEMKNRMLGILAHDLRSPISVILGRIEYLEIVEEKLSDKVSSCHTAITESATFMNELIGEVLAVAIAEAGEIKLNRQRVDLLSLASRAIEALAPVADKKGVGLIVDGGPTWVELDVLKIEQVLNNLIGNAIKFSNRGGVVRVSVGSSDGTCFMRIEDQGVGIPSAIRAQMFEPFCKGQKGTSGERTNGLGLHICSRIAAAHQGRIEVESEPGKGATFLVSLVH